MCVRSTAMTGAITGLEYPTGAVNFSGHTAFSAVSLLKFRELMPSGAAADTEQFIWRLDDDSSYSNAQAALDFFSDGGTNFRVRPLLATSVQSGWTVYVDVTIEPPVPGQMYLVIMSWLNGQPVKVAFSPIGVGPVTFSSSSYNVSGSVYNSATTMQMHMLGAAYTQSTSRAPAIDLFYQGWLPGVALAENPALCSALRENPRLLMAQAKQAPWLNLAGASGGADLAAAATAQASATAALNKTIALAAAAAAQATAGADLLQGVSLAASGLSVAAASAQISKTAPLAAAAAVVASGTAGMHLVIDLAGAALVQAVSAASLALGQDLAALGLAQASATAALDVSAGGAVSLAANALAQAGGEATLSLAVQLSAAAMAQVQASATLGSALIQLGASAQANASGGATLWLQVPLSANALANSIGAASVQLVVDLAAHASAQATATGAAQASLVLLADAAVAAVGTAALRVTPPQVVVVGSPKFRVVATGRRFVARAQRRVFRVVA